MAVDSRRTTALCMPRQRQDKGISPERTKIWFEPKPRTAEQKVPVIYYLSRSGQLEHPHFMDVPLSSPKGLYLEDVTNRLNFLRGQGMANMYSWSSKRSHRNGFVWQDLSKNDFIYPCHGREYVLKGSQLLETSLSSRSCETISSSTSNVSSDTNRSSVDSNVPVIPRKRIQSKSSFDDLRQFQVYMAKTAAEFAEKAANAATQTEDKGTKRGKDSVEAENLSAKSGETDLSAEDVSLAFSKSTFGDNLGSLEVPAKVDGSADTKQYPTVENDRPSGRVKASTVLMQLIKCGSRRIRDCQSTARIVGEQM